MDDSGSALNNDDHSRCHMLIGCGQWAVTLRRIYDVMYATQTMARFSAAPKQEHLKRMLCIFGYLKNHPTHMALWLIQILTVQCFTLELQCMDK